MAPGRHRSRSRDAERRRSPSPQRNSRRDDRGRFMSPHRRHRSASYERDRSRSPDRKRRRRDHSRSRSRSRDRSRRDVKGKRRRDDSASSSSSDEDEDRRHRRHRKHKRSKSEERERRERKARKRAKKEKKKRKTGAAEWGKYGLITETDIFSKGQEFHTWLLEERKINPENLTKEQSKKEFARFIEDFNTATLPHEKFYNMDAYEKRMDAMRSGQTLTLPDDGYDPNADMRALAGARKKKASEAPSYLSRDQLEELRKVQNERVQAGKMKLLGMDIKPSFGVRMEEAEDEE